MYTEMENIKGARQSKQEQDKVTNNPGSNNSMVKVENETVNFFSDVLDKFMKNVNSQQ